MKAKATVGGAISIVNAIASGKGATLGTSLNTDVTLETKKGSGVLIQSENKSVSSRLITKVIQKIVPKSELAKIKLNVNLKTKVPTGYGLKTSSAISSAVALACAKLFRPTWKEKKILHAGINASLETGVSITGAYDDVCGCYYGGFAVTNNYQRKIIKKEKAPANLSVMIFLPRSRKRGNVKNLKKMAKIFEQAWEFAKNADYWNAMILNGFVTASVLDSDPTLINRLVEKGALGASISGNGPAIAAVSKPNNLQSIKKIFSSLEGRTIVSQINNKKAQVHEL